MSCNSCDSTIGCICVPPGSADCQILSWNPTTQKAEWTGKPFAVGNLAAYEDDCTSAYICGDVCLSWTASPGAVYYRVFKNGILLVDYLTDTQYLDTITTGGFDQYSVYAVSCAGLTSDASDILVTTSTCAPSCFEAFGCGAGFLGNGQAGFGLQLIGAGNPPSSSCTTQAVTLTTGNYSYYMSFVHGGKPQEDGLFQWRLVTQLDGVTVNTTACFTNYDLDSAESFSFTGSTTPGPHTFITYLQRCGSQADTYIEEHGNYQKICNL